VATAAIPRARWAASLPRLRKQVIRHAVRLLKPAKPVLANLAAVPLHVAGLGCIDFAAFHLAHGWGWLATGVSLIWLEHVIADEP
jgi:hypothetical protein